MIASTRFPEDGTVAVGLDAMTVKTLLFFGGDDPVTGSRHGREWQRRLPDARPEMVSGAGHDLLVAMWGPILSDLAPRRGR